MTDHEHPTDVSPDEEAAQYDDSGAHDIQPVGEAGVSVIPFDPDTVLADPSLALLTAHGPAKRFLLAVAFAFRAYDGPALEVVVRPRAKP